jgi:hypothetical protein
MVSGDYSHFYNEAGEPMQDGPSMRYEMQLDAESDYERAYDEWNEGYYSEYDPNEYIDDEEDEDTNTDE